MSTWLVVVAAGIVSYGLRLSFVALAGRFDPPPWFERGTGLVMPAALAALAAPSLMRHSTSGPMALPVLVALAATALVARRGHQPGVALAAGLGAMWAVLLAFSAA